MNAHLLRARDAACALASRLRDRRWAVYAAWIAASDQGRALGTAAYTAWNASPDEMPTSGTERAKQYRLLCCIVGTPSRPTATVEPAWLSWHDSLLVSMARQMYDSRDFTDMPVLADALEEAGCSNQDILGHCRNGGVHVRGCWVADSLLGKE